MIYQQTVIHHGTSMPVPPNRVALNVPADYTGRLVVELRGGEVVHASPLAPQDIISSLVAFIEIAGQAGWTITPPPPTR